mgnify:CR=1 FL=1|tara:strand:+ start:508 stop:1338 length:831 start_codon:yes stop_codon:yes gene_type:complete
MSDFRFQDVEHLALDPDDGIVKCWQMGTDAHYIKDWKELKDWPVKIPVAFRSMVNRKVVKACQEQERNFYYIDTGYLGNRQKRKIYHRVVVNGMQHSNFKEVPDDRWKYLNNNEGLSYLGFPGWKKDGRAILLVTPSEKPCKFYGITRDKWLEETIHTIEQNTDRPIIIRDKGLRRDRIGNGSIYNQLDDDDIFAVVTYNSIAATEAIGYGVPAFTSAPGIADMLCEKDLSKIETPKYSDKSLVNKWQHWVAYCQYTTNEMVCGKALRLINEWDLS